VQGGRADGARKRVSSVVKGEPGRGERIDLGQVRDAIISCHRCPRLREHCERIGRDKRRAFREETYWAKPVPGFGDPRARLLILGSRTSPRPGIRRTG
jgi:uracil-DNA glycosylase